MNLRALLLCSDEKIVRVLRRTLGDLEIDVEHCGGSELAVRTLTRERFEAIVVDCVGESTEEVLRSVRMSPTNKRMVAVAILEPTVGMRAAFDLGANFVLYKPVSAEKAKSSFRAARALMKKERRRNARVPVQIPVQLLNPESGHHIKATTIDLGEGGMAVTLPRRSKLQGRWQVDLTLPGTESELKVDAQFAWEGSGTQVGLRFENRSQEAERVLRAWLEQNSPEAEKDDPPVSCRLVDLTHGGCYLESASPFPLSTRLTLSMRTGDTELGSHGVVRLMHPDRGMGVEFMKKTAEDRSALEKFLGVLGKNREQWPELLVEPEGLEAPGAEQTTATSNDVLLGLFKKQASLPADAFLAELKKRRGAGTAAGR